MEEFVIRLLKNEIENETYQEGMSIEERKHLQSILPNKLTELTVDKILCKALIKKAVLSKDRMKLSLNKDAAMELLRRMIKGETFKDLPQDQEIIEQEYPCKMTAVRNGAKMIVGEGQGVNNATLKDALKKSMEYHRYLLSGKYSSAREIAEQVEGNKDARYVYHILNLRFLAADILGDILTDKLSDYYTVKEMSKCGGIRTADLSEKSPKVGSYSLPRPLRQYPLHGGRHSSPPTERNGGFFVGKNIRRGTGKKAV